MNKASSLRIFTVLVILVATTYISYFSLGRLREVPIRKPLADIPGIVGQWNETNQLFLEDKIVGMLGVDEYLERVYVSSARGNQHVDLYVSYFNVLKEGKQFHSPKNCLVGSIS